MSVDAVSATPATHARSDFELLRRVPIFAGLEAAQLHILAFSASRISLERGEVLYEAGSRPAAGYLVLEGTGVATVPERPSAGQRILAKPGWFLAELAMVADLPVSTTLRARTPMRLLKIAHELFLRVCSEFPEAGASVLVALSNRLDASLGELNEVQRRLEGARALSRS
jgi:CRP-like cAMP-binding protein